MSGEKKSELVEFMYFSECGDCGANTSKHQEYCDKKLNEGYALVNITQLGGLDDRRDSYEGTLIYHWKLKKNVLKELSKELNKIGNK
jgi:hypothetical protein